MPIGATVDIASPPGVLKLTQYVLSTVAWVGHNRHRVEGIVDTGAPFTVIPPSIWERVTEHLEWLSDAADESLPRWLRFGIGYTGGEVPCRMARLPCGVIDISPRFVSGPTMVVAKCLLPQDRVKLKHCLLIGLQHSLSADRVLQYDATHREAALLDAGRVGGA
jgi:hypothetical protein